MKTKKEIEKIKEKLDKEMTKLLFKSNLTEKEKTQFIRVMAQIELITDILK